jgi:glycosyltransferase involved in cell wall biosynthesis
MLPWAGVGGTEVATLRIARTVDPEQFVHLAMCSHPASEAARMFADAGIHTESYDAPYLALRRPMAFWRDSARLARQLRSLRTDLVHCADVPAAFHAVFAARLAGLPLVCHVRNPYPRLPRRYRALFRLVSRFVFVSRHTREHFAFRVPDTRATVIYDGIESPQYSHREARASVLQELRLPVSTRLVGMAARLSPQKDHETLLRAVAEVARTSPDIRLVIVGHSDPAGGVSQERLGRLADQLGLGAKVTFTGFRTDVPRLLAAMDVVVLATHFEGLPLVLLEALGQGRPVVATAVGGIPELLTDNETGLTHRHQDPSHLAAQLLSLLRDEAYAMRLAEAGRQLVKDRFTMEAFSRNMADLYRSLLPLRSAR